MKLITKYSIASFVVFIAIMALIMPLDDWRYYCTMVLVIIYGFIEYFDGLNGK